MRNDLALIRKVMSKKKWWRPYEIQTQCHLHGKFWSESSITARLREMNDVFGMRRSKISRQFDYSLVK